MIYKEFSGTKVRPGQPRFISLEELNNVCRKAGILEEGIDVGQAYNLSMMTQINELTQERIFMMNFTEFLEALGRIAEMLSPMPVGMQTEKKLPIEERQQFPLYKKLEAFIIILMQSCMPKASIPSKSRFDVASESSDDEDIWWD